MINIVQLGTITYADGLALQARLVELRKAGAIGDVLLLLEHTPVITLGRNARRENLLASPELLNARGVGVYECDRGGDITFHGPGQLVGYPILDLRGLRAAAEDPDPSQKQDWVGRLRTLGAVDYVRRLEEVLIRTCLDYRIPSERIKGMTGVWTAAEPAAKIAAIGVHISRGVTSHGFALNVNTDLDYFKLIVPCGIASKPVTSLSKEIGAALPLDEVAQAVARNFGRVFSSQVLWLDSLDALLPKVGVPLKVPAELKAIAGEEDNFSV